MTDLSPVSALRTSWRRMAVWAFAALVLGMGFAAASSYVIGDFLAAQDDSASQVYLVSVPAEEDMLRHLSAELMQGGEADPTALSDIAPAAGEPLGTLGQ